MRSERRLKSAIERETFVARFAILSRVDAPELLHAREHCALPRQRAARRRWTLRQRREPRRLRDGQLVGSAGEVAPAGAGDADGLLAVRRKVDVERQDLA